ncbi:MAG: T9SS type A sorting domain-containing protein [Bacteroidota bacterium]
MRTFLTLLLLCTTVQLGLAQTVTSISFETSQSMDGLYLDPASDQLFATGGFQGTKVYLIDRGGDFRTAGDGLVGPIHLTRSTDGNLYATDFSPQSTQGTVSRITPDGRRTVFARVKAGPSDIVADADGNLYVTHYGGLNTADGRSVSKITPDGQVSDFSSGGRLVAPVGIAMDDEGFIYTANIFDGRIVKIAPDGSQTLFAALTPVAPFTIGHLAWANGRLFATHLGAHQIYAFERDGTKRVVAGSGQPGHTDGPAATATFRNPNGIAASVTGDTLYVSEYVGSTRQLRMITGVGTTSTSAVDRPASPTLNLTAYPNPMTTQATITYTLPRAEHVSVVAYDLLGREVKNVAQGFRAAGSHVVEWVPQGLADGVYVLRLLAGAYTGAHTVIVR